MKKLITLLIALAVLLSMTACGAQSKASNRSYAVAPQADYAMGEMALEAPGVAMDESGLSNASDTTSHALPDNRKWIITADMSVETENLEALLAAMDDQIAALGGYVEEQRVNNGSTNSDRRYRNAHLTVRIPAEQVDSFTAHMEGLSNVVYSSKSLEDITLTYVSTESRMNALRAEESRLLELMAMAADMSDLLEIESRLTEVRWELERVTSQLRTFDNQVNYATIYLSVSEVKEYTPVEEKTVWQRIGDGFLRSLKSIGNGTVELLVWLLVSLPYLLIIGVVIFLFIRILRKRRAKRRERRMQQYANQKPQPAQPITQPAPQQSSQPAQSAPQQNP